MGLFTHQLYVVHVNVRTTNINGTLFVLLHLLHALLSIVLPGLIVLTLGSRLIHCTLLLLCIVDVVMGSNPDFVLAGTHEPLFVELLI